MGFNGSGSHSRTNGTNSGSTLWASDATDGTKITTSRHDLHDQDISDSLTACVTKTGESTPTANLPMGGYLHTNVGAATARTHYAQAAQIADGALIYGGTAGGTANALTATLSPAVTAYATGMMVAVKIASTNTSTVTLNINSVSATAVKHRDGSTALAAGDLVSGQMAIFEYTGSVWALMTPGSGAKPTVQHSARNVLLNTTSGTQTDMDATNLSHTLTVLSGQKVRIRLNITFSTDTSGADISIAVLRDGSQRGTSSLVDSSADTSTNGYKDQMQFELVESPSAGTYVYNASWSVGSGTAYSLRQWFTSEVFYSS